MKPGQPIQCRDRFRFGSPTSIRERVSEST